MKLKTPYKTVMFYGNALRINVNANWLAVDKDGTITAFTDKPCVIGSVWDVTGGEIWNIDARAKFEDENWKDTLTHCPHDQKWMIEEAAKLEQAWNLHVIGLLPSEAKELELNSLADALSYRAEGNTLQATWDSWMKHAVSRFLHDEDFTKELYNRLFARHKEPESRIVKDYYGLDVIVPGWTRWIAMNCNGSVMAFEVQPGITPWDIWGNAIHGKSGASTQVAWRDESTSIANWRDSLQEVRV